MKRLKVQDPIRQEMWEHNGKTYSIVDLVMAPLEQNGLRATDVPGSRYAELMERHYGDHRYELALITYSDERVGVIDRFTSFEEARKAIIEGNDEI